jgi:hypothetical protein
MITVRHLEGTTWEVTVEDATTTRHRVNVSDADLSRYGAGSSAEDLLTESFRFLLERESNTSILSTFDLPVIGTYFPEYQGEIQQRLGSG